MRTVILIAILCSIPSVSYSQTSYPTGSQKILSPDSLQIQVFREPITIHVPQDYSTIQSAVDAAVNGDSILVGPGLYYENINFNGKAITVKSSDGAAATVIDGGCAVNPDYGSVVVFANGEENGSVLDGFLLTNGSGSTVWISTTHFGGGVCCYGSSPTIKNNIIINNHIYTGSHADDGGGVACLEGASPNIINNAIHLNSARWGGGIAIFNSFPIFNGNTIYGNRTNDMGNGGGILSVGSNANFINNKIIGNWAGMGGGGIAIYTSVVNIDSNIIANNLAFGSDGGGVYLSMYSTANIYNNTIKGNSAISDGGGIACNAFSGSYATVITNNLIIDNTAINGDAGGIHLRTPASITNCTVYNNASGGGCGGIVNTVGEEYNITNTIVWNNTPIAFQLQGLLLVEYCDIQNGWIGTGNIDQDPDFLDPDKEDFHLSSSSPCIDAGNNDAEYLPEEDFEGDSRKIDDPSVPDTGKGDPPIVDIGADERTL